MEDASLKVCPFCKEKIREEAVKCRYCGEWLDQREQHPPHIAPPSAAPPSAPLGQTEPPPSPKTEISTVDSQKSKKEVSVKLFYWISGVLLALCAPIWIWFAFVFQVNWHRFSPGEQGYLAGKIVIGFLQMLIGTGLLTWRVKRKGYRLLTFAASCAVCTAIFTYYFFDSAHKAQQKAATQNEREMENINVLEHFAQGGFEGDLPEFITTGDADLDKCFLAMRSFYAEYYPRWRQMKAQFDLLQESAISDDTVLTNKSHLSSEIQKRIAGQELTAAFRTNAFIMFAELKRNLSGLNVKDEYGQGMLRSVDNMSPQIEAMFAASEKSQKTEQGLLQFLYANFDDYQVGNGEIHFGSESNRQRYGVLVKDVQDAVSQVDDFQRRAIATSQATKSKLLGH